MPSAGAIVGALVLLILGLLAGVIGAELLIFGGKVIRDGYRALRWSDTDIQDGFVKTTATLRDGDGNRGFFRKQAPLVYAEAGKRNMFNLLRKTKGVEETIVEIPAIDGAVVERDLRNIALAQPASEDRFDIVVGGWTVEERYGGSDELPEGIQRGLADFDKHTGFLKSVEISEYRASYGDTVRLLGLGTIDGVSSPKRFKPDGRFLLGINVSWRKMALNRFSEGSFSALFGLGLLIVAGALLVSAANGVL